MKVKDHNNKEFQTKTEMCNYYNIQIGTFNARIKAGMTLQEALETPTVKCYTDYKGNIYNTLKSMCDAYGVSTTKYIYRMNKGYSQEEALNNQKSLYRTKYNGIEIDGKTYNNLSSLCKEYNVSIDMVNRRLKAGYSLKDALTIPKGQLPNTLKLYIESTDHKGNKYHSKTDMCKAYGVTLDHFDNRIKRGYTLQEALEGKFPFKDHKGNAYKTAKEMCKHYGITYSIYRGRLNKGWSQEKALETPTRTVTDHKGNIYANDTEMAKAYGINPILYRSRKRYGWSVERALTTKTNKCGRKKQIQE